ncbi:hypothetical protein SUDANB6_01896 [Streptomyces sp. enrichment culture]|uniref:hypothetical protein n=1 Tax=Streptomyces sp. enrichment culture TaxID=1795815 RepID=UPI003F54A765
MPGDVKDRVESGAGGAHVRTRSRGGALSARIDDLDFDGRADLFVRTSDGVLHHAGFHGVDHYGTARVGGGRGAFNLFG